MTFRPNPSMILVLPILISAFGLIALASSALLAAVFLILSAFLLYCVLWKFVWIQLKDDYLEYRFLIFVHWSVLTTEIRNIKFYYAGARFGGVLNARFSMNTGGTRELSFKFFTQAQAVSLLNQLLEHNPTIQLCGEGLTALIRQDHEA